jgi:hypothetical protein
MKSIRFVPAVLATAIVVAFSAAPAFARGGDGDRAYGYQGRGQLHMPSYHRGDRDRDPRPVVNVPEIDAASGLAALAAICGALAFAWERRRQTGS